MVDAGLPKPAKRGTVRREARRPSTGPSGLPDVEHDLAGMAARADLRLRFDKVALRVIGTLQGSLADIVPEAEAVLVTITAPIRFPAKTAAAIRTLAQGNLPGARIRSAVHGNDVRLRWIGSVQPHMPKVVGLVHNSESNAELLLDLAEARLSGTETPHRGKHS